MTRKEHNVRMIIQRLVGILMLAMSYVAYQLCVTAVETEDAGCVIILVAFGLYCLFTRKLIFK